MTNEQQIAAERKAHAKYEERTTGARVNGQEVTIAELRRVFEMVEDKDDWKAPWAAAVPHDLVPYVVAASRFFNDDIPRCVGIEPLTGRVLMEGRGYQAY